MKDEPIRRLSALEAIRDHPEMYVRSGEFGSVPDQLLQSALCHPLAELSCGTASKLEVVIHGLTASISDDGAGWPVHPVAGGRRFAETLLADLYACRDHKQHVELALALCRITLPVVVALSEVFTLDIHREGVHWQQTYHSGMPDGPLDSIGSSARSGTALAFTLDQQFCGNASFSASGLNEWLATLEKSVPIRTISVLDT